MPAALVVVPLKPGSDGDYTHKPPDNSTWTLIDPPTLYLERIGLQWMQDRGEAKSGVKYILERLPVGYTLQERPRASGIKDKYLFGHPDHKQFDSPNRFYPHFKHMMEHDGNTMGCPCTVCNPRGGVLPGRPPSTSGYFNKSNSTKGDSSPSSSARVSGANSRSGRGTDLKKPITTFQAGPMNGHPAKVLYKPMCHPNVTLAGMDTSRVDEDGTPDVYRNLIDKLKRLGTLDETIKEPLSLEWRAEQEVIPDLLKKVRRDPQWIPRVGDILLYVRNVLEGCEIAQDPQTCEYHVYDPNTHKFVKQAVWEVGIVGQAPAEPAEDGKSDWYVSRTGVRVEPVPNPNETNKSLSKRYTYVPIEHTRPFCLWEAYVGYIPRDERHPTIQNAFTVSATMSLVGKHRFHGKWPDAQIYCHAIYVGSELIAVGDTVRLAPKAGDEDNAVTDVLVVKTVRLKLSNLDNASSNDYDEGRHYNSEIWIYGSAYTTVASRSSKEWLSEQNAEIPKSASGYGSWYPLHPATKELAVPFSRIVGRLYEHNALESWVPDPNPDSGRNGVLDARHFASKNDKRIVSNLGTTWYWADSRADALDLQTINGFDVGKHDIERDPKEWRKSIKIMEAGAAVSDREPAPPMRSLRGFMAPSTQHQGEESSSSGSSATIGSKRHAIMVSDDEEEVRRQTRIVTNVPYKKSKIQVVVD
ncbi:uncharacterized protein N0V89_002632 [Didymosphaeria variabile]|uniref:Cryptic loci regulator 2 N-terminal domain-containing protein n=1 Tax=Didymosphaeria variabile TaxID=1932322 RepID=A0A9W8XUI3_9PLEO|nr:uncharacterized protein N0V89_002632 [Didymosphaeria variabile]KAJ4358053.1 hypothetical protein N0V89_002632 [Didymosphaeria variabile]